MLSTIQRYVSTIIKMQNPYFIDQLEELNTLRSKLHDQLCKEYNISKEETRKITDNLPNKTAEELVDILSLTLEYRGDDYRFWVEVFHLLTNACISSPSLPELLKLRDSTLESIKSRHYDNQEIKNKCREFMRREFNISSSFLISVAAHIRDDIVSGEIITCADRTKIRLKRLLLDNVEIVLDELQKIDRREKIGYRQVLTIIRNYI